MRADQRERATDKFIDGRVKEEDMLNFMYTNVYCLLMEIKFAGVGTKSKHYDPEMINEQRFANSTNRSKRILQHGHLREAYRQLPQTTSVQKSAMEGL